MPRSELRAVTRIKDELIQRIIRGVYKANAYLPPERDLARELRTSRVTVSAALGMLQDEVLVERHPGRGTRVLSPLDRLSKPIIGVIHGDYSQIPPGASHGSMGAVQGVQDSLTRLEYRYEMMAVGRPHGLSADAFARFGALIFVEHHPDDEELLVELKRRGVPVVVAKLEVDLDVSCTYVDHFRPAFDAVHTLVGLRHRRIAFVGRNQIPQITAHKGYLASLGETGLAVDDALISFCENSDALSGYFAAKPVLEAADPATAIIAGRDCIAEGVCRAIEEHGLLVGHDVSVIGFDDMTWPQKDPILTTFHEPCFEMGVGAAEMLVARIVNPSLPTEKRKFESPFILRSSAGPPMPNGRRAEAAAHLLSSTSPA
jgi:DNA-binding LacI/PurR family transcriptional regulator